MRDTGASQSTVLLPRRSSYLLRLYGAQTGAVSGWREPCAPLTCLSRSCLLLGSSQARSGERRTEPGASSVLRTWGCLLTDGTTVGMDFSPPLPLPSHAVSLCPPRSYLSARRALSSPDGTHWPLSPMFPSAAPSIRKGFLVWRRSKRALFRVRKNSN